MPVYEYKALDTAGSASRGTITADTPAAGRERLRESGLQLVEFDATRFHRKGQWTLRTQRPGRREKVAEFSRQLAMLLAAGVPLVGALDVLIQQERGSFDSVLRAVREKVASGQSLSDALAEHPRWFEEIFSSAVQVGQMSGHLETSLRELASFMRERETIRTRLFTALAYPIILSLVGTAVVIFLMSYVVPQLLTVLEAAGRSLPAATVFLKGLSDFVTAHWLALSLGSLVSIVTATASYKWRPVRRKWHEAQLAIPLLGPLIRKAVISRFAQAMSLLLGSGVPFVESLRLVTRNTQHLILARELEQMETAIQNGSDIAPTLADSRVFPPSVVHVVAVGQESGELTKMLVQLRDAYGTEVSLAIGKFTATLEPVLIVVMSAVVGFIVFATMMPILEVTRTLQ